MCAVRVVCGACNVWCVWCAVCGVLCLVYEMCVCVCVCVWCTVCVVYSVCAVCVLVTHHAPRTASLGNKSEEIWRFDRIRNSLA